MQSADEIITFWFTEHGEKDWFGGGPDFDTLLHARFGSLHEHVARGEAWRWRETSEGRLAEIIVLDQFSRQIHRGKPKAFAQDAMALALAQEAVAGGHDQRVAPRERMFFYLPYMHSESLVIHEEALRLYEALGNSEALEFEHAHIAVLKRFGRYPRRNDALGRPSSAEELSYIASDEGRF
ncbi:DUF924 domain-containing protein [Arsenicitalea aurantiaca]|uniref:DUF924 domain-containing protein n=1 Tax=Arsenicitalea aurantiaca TaxID=1783274 RepID=A0A433X409_9HYPH|nr:DUF924 family protein [Arsenicitalea aurantiaca]RUT28803.1 DUF924 domain-containing protein [Arsenicitalea aurantiaca]